MSWDVLTLCLQCSKHYAHTVRLIAALIFLVFFLILWVCCWSVWIQCTIYSPVQIMQVSCEFGECWYATYNLHSCECSLIYSLVYCSFYLTDRGLDKITNLQYCRDTFQCMIAEMCNVNYFLLESSRVIIRNRDFKLSVAQIAWQWHVCILLCILVACYFLHRRNVGQKNGKRFLGGINIPKIL